MDIELDFMIGMLEMLANGVEPPESDTGWDVLDLTLDSYFIAQGLYDQPITRSTFDEAGQ